MSEGQQDPAPHEPRDAFTQEIQHSAVAARVPEDVAKGWFANTTLIVQLHDVFAIDFISTIVQSPQLVSRVILTPNTFSQFIGALRANIQMYESHFGRLASHELRPARPPEPWPGAEPGGVAPPSPDVAAPAGAGSPGPVGGMSGPAPGPSGPSAPRMPTADELYEQLKFNDKQLGGCFAGAVLIRHMSEEFCFDFIANSYPRAVVTSRIIMPAGRVPALLGALEGSWQSFLAKFGRPPE